jgi:hypothetical protein
LRALVRRGAAAGGIQCSRGGRALTCCLASRSLPPSWRGKWTSSRAQCAVVPAVARGPRSGAESSPHFGVMQTAPSKLPLLAGLHEWLKNANSLEACSAPGGSVHDAAAAAGRAEQYVRMGFSFSSGIVLFQTSLQNEWSPLQHIGWSTYSVTVSCELKSGA